MRGRLRFLFPIWFLLIGGLLPGCAVQVQDDYRQYLINNQGQSNFQKVSKSVRYFIDPKTENHSEEIRAWMSGIANSWTVRFGDILNATMKSYDMRQVFGQVEKAAQPSAKEGLLLAFSLRSYRFENFQASVDLETQASFNNQSILMRRYQTTGRSQGGKMFWGGAFSMKNAIQQSTKSALDQIFAQLTIDLKTALSNPPKPHKTVNKQNPWNGNWYGANGPYQIYISLNGKTVSGRVRDASSSMFDVSGTVSENGEMRALYGGDAQIPSFILTGKLPTLMMKQAGQDVGIVRMVRRR